VYFASGNLVNAAEGIAVGDCIPIFKVDPSGVIAQLEILPGQAQQALLDVNFSQVAAATQLNCMGYPAGTTNKAVIALIDDLPLAAFPASAKQYPNHILETKGYQTFGQTMIFLTPVRP
jgi:hypothetical protein